MGWTSFLLGRPGSELKFEVSPEAMSVDYDDVKVLQTNLAGDLKKSVLKVECPTIQIKSSYLSLLQRNQFAALRHVTDTFLSFQCRDDFQVYYESAYIIDSTHIQLANTSATRLSAALAALSKPSIITVQTPFYTVLPAPSNVIVITAGINDAIDWTNSVPTNYSCVIPPGNYTPATIATAVATAMNSVGDPDTYHCDVVGGKLDIYKVGSGFNYNLKWATGPHNTTNAGVTLGWTHADTGLSGNPGPHLYDQFAPNVPVISFAVMSAGTTFNPGTVTYADATGIITLSNALASITAPIYVSYVYTGWLVEMTKITPQNKGGWVDRSTYDIQLRGA